MLFAQKAKGVDPNEYIRSMRPFQNPSLYEKLVEMMEIDQTGGFLLRRPRFVLSVKRIPCQRQTCLFVRVLLGYPCKTRVRSAQVCHLCLLND